jgi:hypothetical protein
MINKVKSADEMPDSFGLLISGFRSEAVIELEQIAVLYRSTKSRHW